jgi:hypothetical protein
MASKRIIPSDLINISTRSIIARGNSDVRSKSGKEQCGSLRLESSGMLKRLHNSVFGTSYERE